jgi:hypothetical protein
MKAGKWLRRLKKANHIGNARHADRSSCPTKLRSNTDALSPQG